MVFGRTITSQAAMLTAVQPNFGLYERWLAAEKDQVSIACLLHEAAAKAWEPIYISEVNSLASDFYKSIPNLTEAALNWDLISYIPLQWPETKAVERLEDALAKLYFTAFETQKNLQQALAKIPVWVGDLVIKDKLAMWNSSFARLDISTELQDLCWRAIDGPISHREFASDFLFVVPEFQSLVSVTEATLSDIKKQTLEFSKQVQREVQKVVGRVFKNIIKTIGLAFSSWNVKSRDNVEGEELWPLLMAFNNP